MTSRVDKMDEALIQVQVLSESILPAAQQQTHTGYCQNESQRTHKTFTMRVKTERDHWIRRCPVDQSPQLVRWNGRHSRSGFHIAIALAENEAGAAEDGRGRASPKSPRRAHRMGRRHVVRSSVDGYRHDVHSMDHSRAGKTAFAASGRLGGFARAAAGRRGLQGEEDVDIRTSMDREAPRRNREAGCFVQIQQILRPGGACSR